MTVILSFPPFFKAFSISSFAVFSGSGYFSDIFKIISSLNIEFNPSEQMMRESPERIFKVK